MNQAGEKQRQTATQSFGGRFASGAKKYWQYYILLLPALVYFIIFCYGPMYGIQIAFKDFNAKLGIWGSPWVGLEHFKRFFEGVYCWDLIKNTLLISLYSLIAGFPLPIILALCVNELRTGWLKKNGSDHYIRAVLYLHRCYVQHAPFVPESKLRHHQQVHRFVRL
jgi:putative aldouronate transport system permease protein